MPPRERQHEGLGGLGGFFCGWTGSRCGSGRLTTGVVRHACRLRRDGTRRFLVWGDYFCGWTGSRCGSMCWPVDRPATHAAAGAAARGVRGETARGGFWFGGITLRLDWESLREHVLAGGPASHACRRGSGSTRGLGVWGDSFAVGLGAVAGACDGRWTGQPRMPSDGSGMHEGLGERRHEEVFVLGRGRWGGDFWGCDFFFAKTAFFEKMAL